MNPVYQLFDSLRVNSIMQGIMDPRLLPAPMIWNKRIPDVHADEGEILARFNGTMMIADLVADDAKAGVYNMGAFSFYSTKVPNLKMGVSMNQAQINVLGRLKQYYNNNDLGLFTDWQNRAILWALYGVQLRKEVLKMAMLMDSMNYDRLGIKITNGTWGMPATLQITANIDWSNPSATPITDLRNAIRVGRRTMGKNFRRATMSTLALQYASQTTEYQTQVKNVFLAAAIGGTAPTIPLQSDAMVQSLLQKLVGGTDDTVGFIIEIDDRHIETTSSAGLTTVSALQPVNKVILTDPADDGNPNVFDFAQGIVTESVVGSIVPGIAGILGGIEIGWGPMGYTTAASADLNPAGLTHWGVDRGFPRRHQRQCSACLTVGNFVDDLSTTLPLP